MLHLPLFPVINSRQYFVSVSSSHSSNSHFGTHRAEFVMAVYPVPSIAKCGSDSGAVTCWGWVGSYFLQTSPQTPSISLSISHDLVSPGISELSVFGSNMTAALVLFLGAQRRMEPGDQMLAEALITSCWLSCCWLFDPMGKHPFLNCIGKKKTLHVLSSIFFRWISMYSVQYVSWILCVWRKKVFWEVVWERAKILHLSLFSARRSLQPIDAPRTWESVVEQQRLW